MFDVIAVAIVLVNHAIDRVCGNQCGDPRRLVAVDPQHAVAVHGRRLFEVCQEGLGRGGAGSLQAIEDDERLERTHEEELAGDLRDVRVRFACLIVERVGIAEIHRGVSVGNATFEPNHMSRADSVRGAARLSQAAEQDSIVGHGVAQGGGSAALVILD